MPRMPRRFPAVLVALLVAAGAAACSKEKPSPAPAATPEASAVPVPTAVPERNQLGSRGRPIAIEPGDFVVLLVGDAQAEASYLPFDQMPERALEQAFARAGRPAKVFTLASGQWGQDSQLLALRRYFAAYRADLVLLWETPENDLWNNLFPTEWPRNGAPKPTFWLEGGALSGPTSGGKPGETPGGPRDGMDDTAWVKTLPPAYVPLKAAAGPVETLWEERARQGLMKDEDLATEKSHLVVRLAPRSARTAHALKLANALLREIDRICTQGGARLVTFHRDRPGHWTHNGTPSGDAVYRLDGRLYRTSNRQLRDNLAEMNRGIAFVDVPVTVAAWAAEPGGAALNAEALDQVMADLVKALPGPATAGPRTPPPAPGA